MRRPERIAELLREEISSIVGYELDDPRVLGVTVTDVRVAENMRDAKVFVLVEGDEKEIKAAFEALQKAATYIRKQVGIALELRHAPHLHFARDTVEEKARKIELILDELNTERKQQEAGNEPGSEMIS